MHSDDYLWDRSGEADAELAGLEKTLMPYRAAGPRRVARRRALPWIGVGIAASLAIGLMWVRKPGVEVASEWTNKEGRVLAVGETVQAGATGAHLSASLVGQVDLEPGARLKVQAAEGGRRRLSLEHGTLHALIWAPPAKLVVETPSASAVDLGCRYSLRVAPDGSGVATVELGWVAFEHGGQESFIPAGASCRTRRGAGPGLPVFSDATPAFRKAVEEFEISGNGVATLLSTARTRDALTVWHLMSRTRGQEREAVVRAFAKLVPAADSEGLLRKDEGASDAAWNALGLGDTSWWRTWKTGG